MMRTTTLLAVAGLALAATVGPASEPVVTDTRVINETRRVQLLEARLASLQREIEMIEDRKAIERLQQLWGHYVSEGMAAQAADLFSDSPVASIEFAQQGVYLGRQRIQAFLALATRVAPGELRETPVMQPVIHVAADGRTARARWRAMVLGGLHGQDGRWEEGPFENEYVKENGTWKISRMHWYTTVSGSYEKGWHREAYPVAGPLRDLPPDRPPTEVYEAFPAFHLPPYHYLHPVTGKPVAWDALAAEGAR
jgi:hypothetical protein